MYYGCQVSGFVTSGLNLKNFILNIEWFYLIILNLTLLVFSSCSSTQLPGWALMYKNNCDKNYIKIVLMAEVCLSVGHYKITWTSSWLLILCHISEGKKSTHLFWTMILSIDTHLHCFDLVISVATMIARCYVKVIVFYYEWHWYLYIYQPSIWH